MSRKDRRKLENSS